VARRRLFFEEFSAMSQGRTLLAFAGLMGWALFAAGSSEAAAADKPVVVIETSMGNITVELEPEKAPKTVENFLKYVDKGFYDNTIFHRVIPSFMVQGGGMTEDMREKDTDKPVVNESLAKNKNGMSNLRGTIAMARTNDPNSATSQFFINLFDRNKNLDTYDNAGYTAFGKVIEGMDVVDKIAKVETGTKGPHDDVPVKPILIKSIKRKAK
jgi:cyclophilin family peptidyl-prolyl cis-trans isomerase